MSKPDVRRSHDLVDFLRPPIGRCLGAVFSSYDFDEAFFESVLATLLPIHADPDTDPDRFVDEGRRRLRETPVAVLIDGYRARGGHRHAIVVSAGIGRERIRKPSAHCDA